MNYSETVPFISIIICNFNNARWLNDCFSSLNAQTSNDFEVVFVDDASTDESLQIANSWLTLLPQLKIYSNPSNQGKIYCLNKGILEYASSSIIGILDSDDWLSFDAVECIKEAYINEPNAGYIYSSYLTWDESYKLTGSPISRPPRSSQNHLTHHCVSHWNTFKRKYFEQVGGFDKTMLYCEDFDFIYKMEEICSFHYIPKPLYNYRLTANSQSRNPHKFFLGLLNRQHSRHKAYARRNALIPKPKFASLIYKDILIFLYGIFHLEFKSFFIFIRTHLK